MWSEVSNCGPVGVPAHLYSWQPGEVVADPLERRTSSVLQKGQSDPCALRSDGGQGPRCEP